MFMMKQAEEKAENTREEIEKMDKLAVIKENQINELSAEIDMLHDGLDKLGAEYAVRIDNYKEEISINKGNIKR